VDWERAEPADFTTADLKKAPPADPKFAPVPAPASQPKNYKTWEKEFAKWASQAQSIELLRHPKTKIVSAPDESERDFRIRMSADSREARDAALAKIRERYASKVQTLDDRLRKAEQTAQVQAEQAGGAKMQAAVSIGAAVFGALLGRKVVSAGNLGRTATAARSLSKIGREAGDVTRAESNVSAIRQQRDELQAKLEAELQEAAAQFDVSNETLERVLVKPKRGGVSVLLVALVWIPR
jgi:hypothetical protein